MEINDCNEGKWVSMREFFFFFKDSVEFPSVVFAVDEFPNSTAKRFKPERTRGLENLSGFIV